MLYFALAQPNIEMKSNLIKLNDNNLHCSESIWSTAHLFLEFVWISEVFFWNYRIIVVLVIGKVLTNIYLKPPSHQTSSHYVLKNVAKRA